MVEIKFPYVVDKSKYLGMSPQEQESYIIKKMKEILGLNPNGVTIPDIVEKVPFTRPTVIKHLERMVSCREAYKIKRRNFTVYYPNGRPAHPEHTIKEKSKFGAEFRVTFLDNSFGKFAFIEDLSVNKASGGSILINLKELPFLREILEKTLKVSKDIRGV